MKKVATIVIVFVMLSVMMPVTTYAISLVGTRHVESSVAFTRQVTGVRGGTAYASKPGGYPTQLRGDDGELMYNGAWLMAFCAEPGIKAHDGKEGELRVQTRTPEQIKGGLQAAWLINAFYNAAYSEDELAALQIAVWEVIVDHNRNYDLSSGDFKMWGGNQAAIDLANSYLAQVPPDCDDECVACLNKTYLFAVHPSKQDFIIPLWGMDQ